MQSTQAMLKLGKGSAFVKSRLRPLPQYEDIWEADIQPIVDEQEHGGILAIKSLDHSPTVNDLASLLYNAMYRPLTDDRQHRPTTLLLRRSPVWDELLRHLRELEIEVVSTDALPAWNEAAHEYGEGQARFFRNLATEPTSRGNGPLSASLKEEIIMSRSKTATKFSVGDSVRVKTGVTDPDFPDIPFGGWLGDIAEVEEGDPSTYLIQLSERTLNSIHPVYRNRCERDGLELEQIWLLEEDLETDDGVPTEIEQPTSISTEPLSMDDQDDRIRAIFGLTSNDPLPDVDDESLLTYYQYLIANLTFPFKADYMKETGPFSRRTKQVTVEGLGDPDDPFIDDTYGLFCSARKEKRSVDLALGELEVKRGQPNEQLVDDYAYWFCNWG